ncbi:MAG: hypothetical protein NT169_13425 [Chloroflexi bacterium]|nr:hypothetical protein [Chloroflexota bacterium]
MPVAKEDSGPAAVATPVAAETAPAVVSGSVSPTSNASATPMATPAPADEEIDCMGLCHIPDPNDDPGAGAKPLPPSHTGYTTCLECHAAPPTPVAATTPVAPVVSATHLGRLDAACRVCHLTK